MLDVKVKTLTQTTMHRFMVQSLGYDEQDTQEAPRPPKRPKTHEESLQATIERLNTSDEALPCYICNGQVVTDLD